MGRSAALSCELRQRTMLLFGPLDSFHPSSTPPGLLKVGWWPACMLASCSAAIAYDLLALGRAASTSQITISSAQQLDNFCNLLIFCNSCADGIGTRRRRRQTAAAHANSTRQLQTAAAHGSSTQQLNTGHSSWFVSPPGSDRLCAYARTLSQLSSVHKRDHAIVQREATVTECCHLRASRQSAYKPQQHSTVLQQSIGISSAVAHD